MYLFNSTQIILSQPRRRIASLISEPFAGQSIDAQQIALIRQTAVTFAALNRRELEHLVFEHCSWQTPYGNNRVQFCLHLLERMAALGTGGAAGEEPQSGANCAATVLCRDWFRQHQDNSTSEGRMVVSEPVRTDALITPRHPGRCSSFGF